LQDWARTGVINDAVTASETRNWNSRNCMIGVLTAGRVKA
jgi:hypothetical protein